MTSSNDNDMATVTVARVEDEFIIRIKQSIVIKGTEDSDQKKSIRFDCYIMLDKNILNEPNEEKLAAKLESEDLIMTTKNKLYYDDPDSNNTLIGVPLTIPQMNKYKLGKGKGMKTIKRSKFKNIKCTRDNFELIVSENEDADEEDDNDNDNGDAATTKLVTPTDEEEKSVSSSKSRTRSPSGAVKDPDVDLDIGAEKDKSKQEEIDELNREFTQHPAEAQISGELGNTDDTLTSEQIKQMSLSLVVISSPKLQKGQSRKKQTKGIRRRLFADEQGNQQENQVASDTTVVTQKEQKQDKSNEEIKLIELNISKFKLTLDALKRKDRHEVHLIARTKLRSSFLKDGTKQQKNSHNKLYVECIMSNERRWGYYEPLGIDIDLNIFDEIDNIYVIAKTYELCWITDERCEIIGRRLNAAMERVLKNLIRDNVTLCYKITQRARVILEGNRNYIQIREQQKRDKQRKTKDKRDKKKSSKKEQTDKGSAKDREDRAKLERRLEREKERRDWERELERRRRDRLNEQEILEHQIEQEKLEREIRVFAIQTGYKINPKEELTEDLLFELKWPKGMRWVLRVFFCAGSYYLIDKDYKDDDLEDVIENHGLEIRGLRVVFSDTRRTFAIMLSRKQKQEFDSFCVLRSIDPPVLYESNGKLKLRKSKIATQTHPSKLTPSRRLKPTKTKRDSKTSKHSTKRSSQTSRESQLEKGTSSLDDSTPQLYKSQLFQQAKSVIGQWRQDKEKKDLKTGKSYKSRTARRRSLLQIDDEKDERLSDEPIEGETSFTYDGKRGSILDIIQRVKDSNPRPQLKAPAEMTMIADELQDTLQPPRSIRRRNDLSQDQARQEQLEQRREKALTEMHEFEALLESDDVNVNTLLDSMVALDKINEMGERLFGDEFAANKAMMNDYKSRLMDKLDNYPSRIGKQRPGSGSGRTSGQRGQQQQQQTSGTQDTQGTKSTRTRTQTQTSTKTRGGTQAGNGGPGDSPTPSKSSSDDEDSDISGSDRDRKGRGRKGRDSSDDDISDTSDSRSRSRSHRRRRRRRFESDVGKALKLLAKNKKNDKKLPEYEKQLQRLEVEQNMNYKGIVFNGDENDDMQTQEALITWIFDCLTFINDSKLKDKPKDHRLLLTIMCESSMQGQALTKYHDYVKLRGKFDSIRDWLEWVQSEWSITDVIKLYFKLFHTMKMKSNTKIERVLDDYMSVKRMYELVWEYTSEHHRRRYDMTEQDHADCMINILPGPMKSQVLYQAELADIKIDSIEKVEKLLRMVKMKVVREKEREANPYDNDNKMISKRRFGKSVNMAQSYIPNNKKTGKNNVNKQYEDSYQRNNQFTKLYRSQQGGKSGRGRQGYRNYGRYQNRRGRSRRRNYNQRYNYGRYTSRYGRQNRDYRDRQRDYRRDRRFNDRRRKQGTRDNRWMKQKDGKKKDSYGKTTQRPNFTGKTRAPPKKPKPDNRRNTNYNDSRRTRKANKERYTRHMKSNITKFYRPRKCEKCDDDGHVENHCMKLNEIGNGIKDLLRMRHRRGRRFRTVNAIQAKYDEIYGTCEPDESTPQEKQLNSILRAATGKNSNNNNNSNSNNNNNSNSNSSSFHTRRNEMKQRELNAISRSVINIEKSKMSNSPRRKVTMTNNAYS